LPDCQKTVAVVDDDAPVRRALARVLRSAGYVVKTFPGGTEFLLWFQSGQPDCLLLDLNMPGMTGVEVLARLAAVGSRVPIVVITGTTEEGTASRAMHAGAVAVLQKPINGRTLLHAVAEAICGTRPASK
jgi:FixJ family two-component response regulator